MEGRLAVLLCVMTFFSPSAPSPFNVTAFLQDGVKGTWQAAPPNDLMLFFCAQDTPTPVSTRHILASEFVARLVPPCQWLSALDAVNATSEKRLTTYVVDRHCPGTDLIFQKASELQLLRSPNRWLVLNISSANSDENACRSLAAELTAEGSVLPEARVADADFVLVCGADNGSLSLVDLWGPLAPTPLGHWSLRGSKRFYSDRKPPTVRRYAIGLGGYVMRTAIVITREDTYLHLDDGIDIVHDYMTKFNWGLVHDIGRMLNTTIEPVFTSDFGYKINGTWSGTVGLQHSRAAELGGAPSVMTLDRMPVQAYTNFHTPVSAIFIFREPPMSFEYNLFAQPFPTKLWIAIVGLVTLGAVMLYGTLRVEEVTGVRAPKNAGAGVPQIAEGRKRMLYASWSDVALLTFGAVCQQGSPVEARGVPGRIVTLFLFIGILFFYTSYSASIVALLQSTATNIDSFADFLTSRITVGIENTSYNRYFLSHATEPLRKKVYQEKIVLRGRRDPHMSLEEGIHRVRVSYFAFFSVRTHIYAVIAATFQEHEKCGLRELDKYVSVGNPHMTISRWSTHKKLVKIALRKIHERGIRQRQIQRFVTPKPVCVNQGGNFQSVSLIDCFAAFVVLGIGLGLAAGFLLLEYAFFHRSRFLRC